MKYKKKKKQMTVTEQVGDTSGFNEENVALDKKRKFTLYLGLLGIGVLLALAIFFFASPTKVYFSSGKTANAVSYNVDKDTGLIENCPTDESFSKGQIYYEFCGWYLNANMKGTPLFNNEDDTSLAEYKFSKFKSTTLYGKWMPTKFYITYDYAPEDQFEGKSQSFLRQINTECRNIYEGHSELSDGINPTYVTIKHELSSYEEEEYFNLASSILSKTAGTDVKKNQQELMDTVSKYRELCKYSSKTLTGVDTSRVNDLKTYTFIGWFDKDGNKVESISLNDPVNITLYAHYEKN